MLVLIPWLEASMELKTRESKWTQALQGSDRGWFKEDKPGTLLIDVPSFVPVAKLE